MKTYIGQDNCSRCLGNDPNCYVCNDHPERLTGAEKSIRGYSNEALDGAIRHLSLVKKWPNRLEQLKKEKQRRNNL